jgi:CheY-like chemotaxis protein
MPTVRTGSRTRGRRPPTPCCSTSSCRESAVFDVLAGLRAESSGAALPVIAVTASVMDQDRKKILSAGFDAYVPKPVNIRELVVILNDLLAKIRT